MNTIQNNPFRILGVYANASIKDIKANEAKAKAFLNVGREVSYPCDFDKILSKVERDAAIIAAANSALTLPNDKIGHALFWFAKVTPLDEIAFNHLAVGNAEEATNIWNKRDCFSSLLNKSTLGLLQGNLNLAVPSMMTLLQTDLYRLDFVRTVIDETFQIPTNELVGKYLNAFPDTQLQELMGILETIAPQYKELLKGKIIAPLISAIETEITKAKTVKRDNPNARYNAGVALSNNTRLSLKKLKDLLSTTDMQYQMIADKLGLEILQCAIDYYNNSEDADAAYRAMTLQEYAKSTVVGQMAKDRCKQNTDILQKIINNLPPKEVVAEDRAIKKELEKFCKLPDKIQYAIDLLNNTRPHLNAIKNQLGSNNNYYLKLSTQVVGNALHNLIEEVNESQKDQTIEIQGKQIPISLLLDRDAKIAKIKNALKAAWEAIKLMDSFDLESDFRTNRYNPNRITLKKMCEQMGISTNVYRSTQTSTSNNSGCMLWIAVAIASLIVISCI